MTAYRKTTRKDWAAVGLRMGLLLAVIVGGTVLLGPGLLVLWPLVFLLPLALIVRWHTRTFAYRCRNCAHIFEISFWRNLLSPHGPGSKGGWKLLPCPKCGAWTRAEVLRIQRDAAAGTGE